MAVLSAPVGDYLETLADALGMSLKVNPHGVIDGHVTKGRNLGEGLAIDVTVTIVSSINVPSANLAIVLCRVMGDLGIMAFTSLDEKNVPTIEIAFLDFKKIKGFAPEGYFEQALKTASIQEVATALEPATVMHARRGLNGWTLIDDRRANANASKALEPTAIQPDNGTVVAVEENEQHATGIEGR